ncbi:MAG: peptidoglycan-binding protein [Hyphomicrobiales bacterium]|nr:peptidoglycan-binding protein [Hyphomicrobiales bacterium]
MSYLRKGVSGEPVKILQAKLGVAADGDFGPGTEKALKDYQSAHGLAADGVAGPDTFMAMGLAELVLLGVGSKGETVKKLQAALGVDADGVFGKGTKAAVVAFQEKNGLDVDGFAGPATLAKMPAFAAVVTEAHVAAAEMPAGAAPSGEALPTAPGATADASAEQPPKKSVWGTVKGWFS